MMGVWKLQRQTQLNPFPTAHGEFSTHQDNSRPLIFENLPWPGGHKHPLCATGSLLIFGLVFLIKIFRRRLERFWESTICPEGHCTVSRIWGKLLSVLFIFLSVAHNVSKQRSEPYLGKSLPKKCYKEDFIWNSEHKSESGDLQHSPENGKQNE